MRNALEQRRRGLFAKDVVGVVDIGEVAVEILPKVHEGNTSDEGRTLLADLFRFVGRERGPFATAAANIRDREGGLIEVLYAWAMTTAARYADTGLPRRYMPRTEASTAVRGRIDMKRVALARPGRGFEMMIHHAPLSADNEIVRALRWLVREVASRTRRADTRRVALTLLGELRDITDVEADPALFKRLSLRPLEEHWAPLLAFGHSLARQRSVDPSSAGGLPSVAVLFTLHDLFERALRRVLHDHGPAVGLHPGRIPRYLLRSDAGDDLIRLNPDYVLQLADPVGDSVAVGDAKWKDIWTGADAPEPEPEDAYQLAAYMAAGGTNTGFLFAPIVGSSGGKFLRMFSHKMAGIGATVYIVGVHVPTLVRPDATGKDLRHDLCAKVAAAIRSGNARASTPVTVL